MLRRLRSVLTAIGVLGGLALAGLALAMLVQPASKTSPKTFAMQESATGTNATPSLRGVSATPPVMARGVTTDGALSDADCTLPPSSQGAAAGNAASALTATVTPFGVSEVGWAVYAPMIGREIGTPCGPATPAFAAALGRWQGAHGLTKTERVDAPTLSVLATTWLLRRPFVRAARTGCPPPPASSDLAAAAPGENFGGKLVFARPKALDAYRRMIDVARRAGIAPPLLQIASAYRGPAEEAARCADGSCGTARKARCSAHRTGLAFDFYLGAAPGQDPFSAADANRLYLSRTAAYRWLVANAARFGFMSYPFEPWHWEWTGAPV
jgi:D-alanyl-D-alanine carboxypeptidase